MFTIKCPTCQSGNIKKSGLRHNVQHYRCTQCGRQFINRSLKPTPLSIWSEYLEGKQTIFEIAQSHHVSESTVKRYLRKQVVEWSQPSLTGINGYVHIDATYWGRNWGILLAIDEATGRVLYIAFIKHETTQSYIDAVEAIVAAGYMIKGIIIDGKQELFTAFKDYPIQMCQFHMLQIVKRYLTQNPKMIAARELQLICRGMIYQAKEDFEMDYMTWKTRWKEFLNKRTIHKDGRTYYLHRRIRTLVNSIDFYLPYLFTFQSAECVGMPNTNNKIEGTFTDLKKNLNNHSGLTKEHRQQFIIAYFQNRQNMQPNN